MPQASETRPLPAAELLLGLAVLVTGTIAIALTRVPGGTTLFWPAGGIATATLLRLPRLRPAAAAGAVLLAIFIAAAFVARRPWPAALMLTLLNGAEIALSVAAFRFLWRFRFPNMTIDQGIVVTAVAGVGIPGLAAVAAGAILKARLGMEFGTGALQWWSSHTIGACLFGPPILLFSAARWRRLVQARYLAQNLATLFLILIGSYLLIRYVRFPFVAIATLLLIGAFRLEGFGAALAGLLTGLLIMTLWIIGMRPVGLERSAISGTLIDLPVIAMLATVLAPIAVGIGTGARRATLRSLRFSERRFRESMAHSPIGMLIAEMNGTWTYTNVALQKMLGYSAQELRAMPPGGPSNHDEWEASAARIDSLISGQSDFYAIDRRFRHKDGHWIWTHVAVSLLRNEDGSPQHLLAQIESLEARRLAEAALAEERERLRVTVNSVSEAVVTLDAAMRIEFMNESAQRLLGLDAATARQRRIDEVIHMTDPDTSKSLLSLAPLCTLHGRVERREAPCVLHRPDGETCYVLDTASPVLDSSGTVTAVVLALHDATADVERTRELRERATYDPLTGVVNRAEFQQRLREAFRKARHLERSAVLLAIDLDRFKAVNDTAGHAAGDEVLKRVATVCRMHVRSSDTVARLGGDEFAIILGSCPPAHVGGVCRKILKALNPLEVGWEGATYRVGASIGVATVTETMLSESEWLEAADKACYQAKADGRGELRLATAAGAR